MEADASRPTADATGAAVSYAQRAQTLMAARAELFDRPPATAARSAGMVITQRDGLSVRERPAGRQLSLPLPRERGRRRARMLR